MTSRNSIMDALMAVLKATLPQVQKFTRRYRFIENVSMSEAMPFLILARPKEKYPQRQTTRLPPARRLECEIIIYFSDGQDQAAEPDEALCDLQDAIDLAFKPSPGQEKLTLGGMVESCQIEGDIICVPGDIDGLGLLKVPVIIIIP